MDHSMRQLQREFLVRLRRIETNTKDMLMEIQNGRQDISHLTHLTRSVQNCSFNLPAEEIISKFMSEATNSSTVKNMIEEIHENITNLIVQKIWEIHEPISSKLKESPNLTNTNKGLSSELWKVIFPKKRLTAVQDSSEKVVSSQKQCLDASTFNTLEEVKQLLKTLVSKGEDLREALTKQATDGIELLNLLHQRFSVLLRRMNTDPNHNVALLAEVRELEHLVENSYSSILLAQNLFVESCQINQKQQHYISEENIIEILNTLMMNIDLGQQFNRKQLQEVRKMIEQVTDGDDLGDYLHTWMNSRQSSNNFDPMKNRQLSRDEFLTNLLRIVVKANATEVKLKNVIERITNMEDEVEIVGFQSDEFKNVADKLLTGAKDLKGYSRDQMLSMEFLKEDILELLEDYADFKETLNHTGDEKVQTIYTTPSDLLSEKCSLFHLQKILDIEPLPLERVFNGTTQIKSKKSQRKKGGIDQIISSTGHHYKKNEPKLTEIKKFPKSKYVGNEIKEMIRDSNSINNLMSDNVINDHYDVPSDDDSIPRDHDDTILSDREFNSEDNVRKSHEIEQFGINDPHESNSPDRMTSNGKSDTNHKNNLGVTSYTNVADKSKFTLSNDEIFLQDESRIRKKRRNENSRETEDQQHKMTILEYDFPRW